MRLVTINLILVCLLLFGIGYLAFGSVETALSPEPNAQVSTRYTDGSFGRNFLERSGNATKPSGGRVFNFREHVCLPLLVK